MKQGPVEHCNQASVIATRHIPCICKIENSGSVHSFEISVKDRSQDFACAASLSNFIGSALIVAFEISYSFGWHSAIHASCCLLSVATLNKRLAFVRLVLNLYALLPAAGSYQNDFMLFATIVGLFGHGILLGLSR